MNVDNWTQVEPSGNVNAYEFQRPEDMSECLVRGLGITRQAIGRYMHFTKGKGGRIFHPEGDAVPEDSNSHAAGSLHKIGLADDFDFGTSDPNYLFELYVKLVQIRFDFPPYRWTGIGHYPFWKLGNRPNPGFHVDLRPVTHTTMRDRNQIQTWLRTKNGTYVALTWARFKQEYGLAIIV